MKTNGHPGPIQTLRASLCALLLSSLVACSESEATGESAARPNGPSSGTDSPAVAGESVNGPLNGRIVLFSSDPGNSLPSYDLTTGRWTALDSSAIASTQARFPNATIRTQPDPSGPDRLIFTAKNCEERLVCVGMMGVDGELSGFAAFDEVRDPVFTRAGTNLLSGLAKRSRDGNFIAYTQAERFLYVSRLDVTRQLEGRTSYDASIVSSVDIGYQIGTPYDWLPDGSLLYSQDTGELSNRIVLARSTPGSTDVASTIELGGYRGFVRQILVSPDGRYALLRFIESLVEIPLVLDLSTNEIFEPVSRERTPFLDIGGIVWSPDSRWLLFRLERATSLDALVPTVPIGSSETTRPVYAVRVDGRSRALPDSVDGSDDGARIVLARPFTDPDGPPGPQYATTGIRWVE